MFTDGSTQELPEVWKQRQEGDFLVFYDERAEVYRTPAKRVESVTRSDMPGPEKRKVRSVGI